MTAVVVDENVPLVANGKHAAASDRCVGACIDALLDARSKVVLMDDQYRIFAKYRRNLSQSGQPGAGDAFLKWLWNNQANPAHCRLVPIAPLSGDKPDFAEFPQTPELSRFDPDDRIFVAVAIAAGTESEVLNAADSDWWHFRSALKQHGVSVRFLCPELMDDRRR
jgi:hypothetical protein